MLRTEIQRRPLSIKHGWCPPQRVLPQWFLRRGSAFLQVASIAALHQRSPGHLKCVLAVSASPAGANGGIHFANSLLSKSFFGA